MNGVSSAMKISIIIPAHNEESTIEETLCCIGAQSVQPHEVLVMCNGCTDRTVELVKKHKVRCLVTKKSGLNFARNYAAERAKGDVLLWMDSDAHLAPNFIEELQHAIRGKERFYGSVHNIPDDSRFKYRGYFLLVDAAVWLVRNAANGTVFCSRQLYDEAGGWPESDLVGFEWFFTRAVRRLKNVSYIFLTKTHLVGSTRRFKKEGLVKPTVQWLMVPLKKDLNSLNYDNKSLR